MSELRDSEDMESYSVTNSISYSVAKWSVEQRGGKCLYFDGDLYIEWPGQPVFKVTPVYIQDDGWRYPINELMMPDEK